MEFEVADPHGVLSKSKGPDAPMAVVADTETGSQILMGTMRVGEQLRDLHTVNIDNHTLMRHAVGFPGLCADTNARACATRPYRLFRTATRTRGPGRKRVAQAWGDGHEISCAVSTKTRRYLSSGRAGRKAATWADNASDLVEVTSHPVLEVLARPNPLQSGEQWDFQSFRFAELTGDNFDVVVAGKDRPYIMTLAPQWTLPIPNDDGFVDGYAFGRERSRVTFIDAAEVSHYMMGQHPDDPWSGDGVLRRVLVAADVLLKNEAFDYNLANGGSFPGLIMGIKGMEGTRQQDKIDNLRQRFDDITRKQDAKYSRAHIMTNLESVHQIQIDNTKLQAEERLTRHERNVCFAFGVPESMVKLNDANLASSHNGYSRQYLDLTVRTRITGMAAHRTERLLPMLGLDAGEYCIVYDDPAPDEEAEQITLAAQAIAGAVMTRNQAADHFLGLPAHEDGDILMFNGVPVGQQPAPADPIEMFRSADFAQFREPEALAEPTIKSVKAARSGGFYAQGDCPTCQTLQTKDDDDDLRFGREVAREEAALQGELIELFNRIAPGAARVALRSGEVSLRGFDQEIAQVLEPRLLAMLNSGADAATAEFLEAVGGDDSSFDVVPESAIEAFRRETITLAEDISIDMERSLSNAITRGLEAGSTPQEIAESIGEVGAFSDAQAARIARTEASRAVHSGKLARYQQVGVTRKKLLNAPGPSAVHAEIARRVGDGIPLDEPFVKAGETVSAGGESETFDRDMVAPPLRPNCRCTSVANFDDVLEDLGVA